MNLNLAAILRGIGSYSSRRVAGSRATRAPRRSAEDTPQQSAPTSSFEGLQVAPLAPANALLQDPFAYGPSCSPFKRVRVQVEADVAMLTAGQVPSTLKEFTIIIVKVAPFDFWKEM